jgi:hypothetical protein
MGDLKLILPFISLFLKKNLDENIKENRMKVQRKLVGIATGAIIFLSTATVQAQAIDPGEFRERLIDWALASEQANPTGENLAVKIASLSDEQIEGWASLIDDPEAFMRSTERAASRLQEQGAGKLYTPFVEAPTTLNTPFPLLTTPFPPDYPPGSGPYKDTIIDAISGFNIGGASSTNRCDAADWGDFIGVWWPLNKAFDTLDGACVVAGCDPIGIVCAAVCGTLEVAKIALKVAAVPLEACDIHQGAIDGAEIEATYENTLGLVGDVSHVHADLAAHDTNIDGDLAAHDANIDGDLIAHDANIDADLVAHDANLAEHDADIKELLDDLQGAVDENQRLIKISMSRQLEVLRLLITPSGRRVVDEEVLTCTGEGDDCPVYPATFQLCENGSLEWNCDD